MTLQQAIELIKDVCSKYQGNLQDHQNIQSAINTLVSELNKKVEKPSQKPK